MCKISSSPCVTLQYHELTPIPACCHELVDTDYNWDGTTNNIGICFEFGIVSERKCEVALIVYRATHQSHSLSHHGRVTCTYIKQTRPEKYS